MEVIKMPGTEVEEWKRWLDDSKDALDEPEEQDWLDELGEGVRRIEEGVRRGGSQPGGRSV
jgi:hypothetical protein